MSKGKFAGNVSRLNVWAITLWYVPILLMATVLMLASMPLLALLARFHPDMAFAIVERCETWLDDKDAEIHAAIKRLSRKQ